MSLLVWKFSKQSPSLVIFCFFIYKTIESLLQSANRLHLYSTVCQAVVNRTIDGHLCDLKEHRSSESNLTIIPFEWAHFVRFRVNTTVDDLGQFNEDKEALVQRMSGNYLIVYRILFNLPAMITCLLYGSVSNRIGRKWAMIIPCIGSVIACAWFGAALYPQISRIPGAISFILIGALCYGLCGKSNAMSMGANSYITDLSSTEERTKLLGRLMGVNFFGLCIGAGLLAIFSRYRGIAEILMFVSACDLFLIIVLLLLVRESLQKPLEQPILETRSSHMQMVVEEDEPRKAGCGGFISHAWRTIRKSYEFLFTPDMHQLRPVLLFLFASVLFNQLTKSGEQDAILLFVTNRPFHWTAEWYGYYLTVYYGCMALLLTLFLPLIESKLAPHDSTLIVIGLCFKIARLLCMGLTGSTLLLFISAVAGSVAGFISSGTRALISKLVRGKDVGASFALVSCMETLANLGGGTLFTSVYNWTLTVFPGTVFVIDAILHLAMLCGFIWLRQRIRSDEIQRFLIDE